MAQEELRTLKNEKERFTSEYQSKTKHVEGDLDKLQLEINQLTTERDQLVRQLEKSQDMLLSFQQDLNLTESELKHVANENRRLKEESGASEKGIMESKEREILNLSVKVSSIEFEYDEL